MGRTSFTFPLPGRRQKHQSTIGPLVSTPMSKAQRILGAADLSIDAHSPRQWDDSESSASGISISVSESERTTTSASTATTAYRRQTTTTTEDGPRPTRNVNRWEVESETVPAYVHAGRPNADDAATFESRDYMSDASSLRRRQSSSTLKSWYDKSKMPLSISQQTSSSAMAKGLPSKASALLDVDGAAAAASLSDAASTASTARAAKRPSRLNLSHLFSSSSSSNGRFRDSAFVRPSPSSASLRSSLSSTAPSASPDTPYSTPPSPRTPRRLLRKPTRERLAEIATAAAAATTASPAHRPRSSSSNGAHGAKSTGTSTAVHCPRDLYDHYERAAFRNVLESPAEEEDDEAHVEHEDDAAATRLLISDFPAAPVGPTALKSPPQQPLPQLPPHPLHPRHSTASSSIKTTTSNPVIREPIRRTTAPSSTRSRQSTAETLPSLDHDYPSSLASVSSRHTKTSRHTTASAADSEDRQGRSILSLSSDSEGDSDADDGYDAVSRRSVPSIASHQQPQPPSPASRRSVCSRGADSDSASRKSGGKRGSLATTAGSTYLTVPGGGSPGSLKPTVSPRTSSVNKTQAPPLPTQQPPSYGVHEARAVNLRPVASTARSLSGVDVDVDLDGTAPASLRAGDQPTPPLSPSSVEFCLQPDMTFDAAAPGAGTSSNPRLMAVTRQEQMLLAALRNKRAMMRETMLAEAEGDVHKARQQLRGHKHTSSQATIRGPEEKQHRVLRHQGSGTSTGSTVKSATRSSRSAQKPAAYVEPSPDLSDFMDFDDGMSGSDDGRRPFYSSGGSGSGSSAGDGSMLAPPAGNMTRKKAVRLSAVGTAGPEVDCWGDDG